MTLSEQDVRRALQELSRLRFEVADLEEAMRDIVHATHSIFQVDGAALMLTDGQHHLQVAAVSDSRMGYLEQLQLEHHEGPCLDAYHEHQVVQCADLSTEVRWPTFGPAATGRGLCAVLASPIPFEQHPVGVVVVVSCSRRPWTPQSELALVAFTDLVALLIATTMYAEEQTALATRLRAAMDTRQLVARAAASLAEQEGVSLRAGHQRLKAMSRNQKRAVTEVAADVVTTGPVGSDAVDSWASSHRLRSRPPA